MLCYYSVRVCRDARSFFCVVPLPCVALPATPGDLLHQSFRLERPLHCRLGLDLLIPRHWKIFRLFLRRSVSLALHFSGILPFFVQSKCLRALPTTPERSLVSPFCEVRHKRLYTRAYTDPPSRHVPETRYPYSIIGHLIHKKSIDYLQRLIGDTESRRII